MCSEEALEEIEALTAILEVRSQSSTYSEKEIISLLSFTKDQDKSETLPRRFTSLLDQAYVHLIVELCLYTSRKSFIGPLHIKQDMKIRQ